MSWIISLGAFDILDKMSKPYRELSPQQKARKLAHNRNWQAANKEKYRAAIRAWRVAHREKEREYQRRYRLREYGIAEGAFAAMVSAVGGVCPICAKREPTCVDHCHKTNKVRGALCSRCNSALGFFDDSAEIVRRAADYLRRAQ